MSKVVLGVDPGYRNLGLAVVQLSGNPKILWSDSISVGTHEHGMSFSKVLVPKLEQLDIHFGINSIAMETPPFIQRQIKTSALLWAVGSIIFTWGHMQGKERKHCSPIAIKRGVSKVLGIPWNRKFIPKKNQVKEVVQKVFGSAPRTSHENDAVLAALLLYSKLIYG